MRNKNSVLQITGALPRLFIGMVSLSLCVQLNAQMLQAVDVSPPQSYASDQWLMSGSGDWKQEALRRERELRAYLFDTDPVRAEKYSFREGHNPSLAWNWFTEHPIGYGGVPYVLLQTILSLDPASESNPDLKAIANIWKKRSVIPDEADQEIYTLDHLGFGPNPADYFDGQAKAPGERAYRLPNGLVYDPEIEPKNKFFIDTRLKVMRDGIIGNFFKWLNPDYTPEVAELAVLARGKLRDKLHGGDLDYEKDVDKMQEPPHVDAVFFACSGCHQGRVIVGGEMDAEGNIVKPGRMKFLPGMPNTEVEAQYYSQLLMETGIAMLESGFSVDATQLPDPERIKPSTSAIKALLDRMLTRAIDPEIVKTIYGPDEQQVKRAKLQTYWVAQDFPTYLGDLIGTAIKTQYIYKQVGERYAYNEANERKDSADQTAPNVFTNRVGQMDAFGIASGLVALHTLRPDNSYMKFIYANNPDNPLFAGIDTVPGFSGRAELGEAGKRIRDNIAAWAPPVPAPIDIKSLSWSGHRKLANWDGNQGAAARTLASGTSATGDPLKVNVRIHEPLNPLIENMPPPPYPFDVDVEKAKRGMKIFQGQHLKKKEKCVGCHQPNKDWIIPASELGVDANRTLVNTDVSRFGLADLVMEACQIFIRKNPGNEWCLPKDAATGEVITDWAKSTDDYFKDTPGRVREGVNGYKIDMLHGIWARSPYLHNGSVPTLMHMICPDARPTQFKRGNLFYDEKMVGFEWAIEPRQRYSKYETTQVKTYDTRIMSRSNSGHTFGSNLCPNLSGLDPVEDREEITRRISSSRVGDLVEYLKTL